MREYHAVGWLLLFDGLTKFDPARLGLTGDILFASADFVLPVSTDHGPRIATKMRTIRFRLRN
jgi:hypothetical protein